MFVQEILSSDEFNSSTDISLLTGDFNILKFPLKPNFCNTIIKTNKNFDEVINSLNSEYNDIIVYNFRKNIKDFDFVDFADFYSNEAVTYGDSKFDANGKEIPLDPVLTAEIEHLSR